MLRALQRAGFVVIRIQGSHHFLSHLQDPSRWATVPVHDKETLSPKVVSAILKKYQAFAKGAKGAVIAMPRGEKRFLEACTSGEKRTGGLVCCQTFATGLNLTTRIKT